METVASQTTSAGCARSSSQSGTVSTGFAGASTQTMSASAGGGPVWSYSTSSRPHEPSVRKRTDVPKYAPSASAIFVPGPGEGEHDRRRRGRPRCEEQGVPALEGAELLLGRGARRMGIARVEEVPRLAALVVRPDGGAVRDHHGLERSRSDVYEDATARPRRTLGAERA